MNTKSILVFTSENIVLLKSTKTIQIFQSYKIAGIHLKLQKQTNKKQLIISKNHRSVLKFGEIIYIGKYKLYEPELYWQIRFPQHHRCLSMYSFHKEQVLTS